ncbi:hypothetical protein Scep_026366 [Stephania cephalantha]|uniref:Pectinesterase inhibitor domain-containing protein n=1 Tax=Stephania cephalantha TaxID=152367 RepID=A0AAP0EN66_9MAGN
MRPFLSCLFSSLTFALYFHGAYGAAYSFINETCTRIASNDTNVNFTFCITTLQVAMKNNSVGGLEGLGLATMNLMKTNRYFDANIQVSAVMDASTTCEDGFSEKEGEVSPLTSMNNVMFQLCAIALSITNMFN